MSTGYFILSVRKAGNETFGILETGQTAQRLKFDDNSRDKASKREKVLELVLGVRDRWQTNYKPYADASFRIEEYDHETGELKVVSGVPYDRPQSPEARHVRQVLTNIASNFKGVISRKAQGAPASAEELANLLFIQDDEGNLKHLESAAWRSLDLSERVEICREVAAGFFTPAVA